MAQVGVLGEKKYSRLVGRYRPRLIESDEECDRVAAELEELDRREEEEGLDSEERAVRDLLAHLVTEYEDRTVVDPHLTPVEVLKYLMEVDQLKQVDLLDVFGSSAVTSQVLSGRRAISKAHARKLAERFKISIEAFIA